MSTTARTARLLAALAVLVAGAAAAVHGQSGLITFDPSPNTLVLAVVVQPDGKILLGGNFTTLSPNGGAAVTRNRLARLNVDGTLDTAFNPNVNANVRAIALQADGKIVVGGSFTSVGTETRNRLARLNSDGTLDMSFDPNADNVVRALAIQADGKIIVGGQFTTVGTETCNRIARLNIDGTLDTAFNPNANGTVFAVVLQADGRILAGGSFNGMNSIGGATRNRLARLNSDGTVDMAFDPNASGTVFAIAVQPDGKILAGGDFTSIGPMLRNRLARLEASTGAADSFNPNANLGVFTIALQGNGKILVGGDFTTMGSDPRSRIARFDSATGALDAFDPSANPGASIFSIAVQTDGSVLVGGNYSSISGQPRSHLARLSSDGTIPYLVNTTSDSVVAGACARGLANCSLRGAIEAGNASSGPNAIVFVIPASDPNCSGSVCAINLTQALPDLSTNMSILGPGADKLTVRRGTGGNYRVFTVSTASAVTFSGLTIANGFSTTTPAVGGGIGILSSGSATVNIANCAITSNTALGGGGGISTNGGMVNLENSTLSFNQAGGSSGGNSFFSDGGGIVNAGGTTLTLTNSTISDNSTNSRGGGIVNFGTLIVSNSTISSNTATGAGGVPNDGGGIYTQAGSVNVKSTIIAKNTAASGGPDVSGAFTSFGFNLVGKSDGSTGFTAATDQKGTVAAPRDPKLDSAGLRNNGGPTTTIALLAGSKAIDQGSSNGLTANLSTDQRGSGFPRTSDDPAIPNAAGADGTDIGAFELQISAPPTPTPTATPVTTLANISTRLRVETGDNVLIGGFIITGSAPKKVILRGIGTSLPFADKLVDPTLELHGPSGLIEANDNWVDSPNKQAIIDSTIPPSSDLESAIVAILPANNAGYTAIVRGVNNGTGIGVVEAYDLDTTADSKLANISTRGFVQTGDNVLIAGTIVVGQAPQRVIIRAIGPSLPIAGKMENPTLELRDANGALLQFNDNWVDSADKQAIIDSTIPPTNDFESAIVATLPANNASYTAIVRGLNATTGIAVVEVYALN